MAAAVGRFCPSLMMLFLCTITIYIIDFMRAWWVILSNSSRLPLEPVIFRVLWQTQSQYDASYLRNEEKNNKLFELLIGCDVVGDALTDTHWSKKYGFVVIGLLQRGALLNNSLELLLHGFSYNLFYIKDNTFSLKWHCWAKWLRAILEDSVLDMLIVCMLYS